MITDIETELDAQRWTLAMMKAIRNGVDFHCTDTFNEVDALANAMEAHCKRHGISLEVPTPSQDTSASQIQFRKLDEDEENEFRQWARDNYTVGEEISSCWHPVVRDECFKMRVLALLNGNKNN